MSTKQRRRRRTGVVAHGGASGATPATWNPGDDPATDLIPDAPYNYARTSATLTFVEGGGSADTITRSSGSFLDDGWSAGMTFEVTGTVSDDGTYTIATVVAQTITLPTTEDLPAESAVACVLSSLNATPGDNENRSPA